MTHQQCLGYNTQSLITRMQPQPKSKAQLLIQRLDNIKRNSLALMDRMDTQIHSIQLVKQDLDNKSEQMKECLDILQSRVNLSACDMMVFMNPFSRPEGEPRRESYRSVAHKIMGEKRVCILTGAGVSKNSGIPTFRGTNGLYDTVFQVYDKNTNQSLKMQPEEFITLSTFQKYPQQIWGWCNKMKKLVQSNKPGPQHELINQMCLELLRNGKEVSLVTTNIDSYHMQIRSKNKPNQQYQIHEIHGNYRNFLCYNCRSKQQTTQNVQNFTCKACGCTKLRPFIMFFDQRYDQVFDPANLRGQSFDIILSIGTSLQTGLSKKLVSLSKIAVEINPKCVVEGGDVFQFEEQCEPALANILAQLKILAASTTNQ